MSLVGIIGAMEEEVSQLKEQMTDVQIKKKAAMEFCRGKSERETGGRGALRNRQGKCGYLRPDSGG